MLKTELLELIANGENSGVEFKRDDIRTEQLAKEVVALANFNGGMVLLGVDKDGSITGIQRTSLEEWVMDGVFAHKVHPMILPFYEEVKIDERRRVAVISFTQGTSKPYVVRHQGREEIYIRVGTTSRLASREQQARLFASGGILHPEALPVAGSSVSALDLERVEDYLANIIEDPEVPEDTNAWIDRLLGLGFMVEGVADQPVCSIAGLMLFAVSPRRYLRQAGLRVLAFEGEEKSYSAVLDTVLDAPVTGLWRRDDQGYRTLAANDYGLIERFINTIEPFISGEDSDIDENFRRERRWHYPRDAVRELLINALAHRDWTRSIDIEIAFYTDRMEVISPGALQNSMTIEKMIAGQRSPRNPVIIEVLRDYGYVDARGMGVRTKIIPSMRAHNGTDPKFELTDDYLKTTLYKFGAKEQQ